MNRRAAALVILTILMLPFGSIAQNLLDGPESVAFDPVSRLYLVNSLLSGDIVAVDSTGQQSMWYEDIGTCYGNHIDGIILYVAVNDAPITKVYGFDLVTRDTVWSVSINPRNAIDGLTTDTSGYLYGIDTGGRIYRVTIADSTIIEFVTSGLTNATQDITFDREHNRLLTVGFVPNAPIQAIDLPGNSIYNIVPSTVDGNFDGVYCDTDSFVYTSSYVGGVVRRYENTFTEEPVVVSTGHSGPSGLWYNEQGYTLAVPNFYADRLDLVSFWGKPELRDYGFSDDLLGNGNGWVEAGETIQLTVEYENTHAVTVTDLNITLTCDDLGISILQGTADFASIPPGGTVNNIAVPYEFSVPEGFEEKILTFTLNMTWNSDYGPKANNIPIIKSTGRVPVMLVDASGDNSVSEYYTGVNKTVSELYDLRLSYQCNPPSADVLKMYDAVIWFTGNNRPDLICAEDIAVLQEYLDAGGQLFLTGQGIAQQLSTLDPVFSQNYLHAEYQSSSTPPNLIIPQPDCQVVLLSDSLNIVGGGGAGNQINVDRMAAVNGGVMEYCYYGSPLAAAISYAGDYRVVFFGFGFEAITVGVPDRTDRDTVMARVLDFFQWPNPHLCCMVRGDMDRNGELNISDLTYYVDYLFASGPSPVCPVEGDADGNGEMNISDLTYYVDYLFGGGPAPPGCHI